MSMAETDMVLQAIEGLGGGIDTLLGKQQIPDLTRVSFSGALNANTTETVVNVEGKGRLCLANIYYLDPGIDFIVEIDGVSFSFLSLNETYQARGIVSEENAMRVSNGLRFFKGWVGSESAKFIDYIEASYIGVYLTKDILETGFTHSSTYNSSVYIFSKVDIPFETLKVSIRNKTESDKTRTQEVDVIYRLED